MSISNLQTIKKLTFYATVSNNLAALISQPVFTGKLHMHIHIACIVTEYSM